jgi:hypothetical protein
MDLPVKEQGPLFERVVVNPMEVNSLGLTDRPERDKKQLVAHDPNVTKG